MRKTLIFLGFIALAGSLWAADPIMGTWKLNVAKSTFGPGVEAPIKEQTNVVQEAGTDQCEVIVTGTAVNGANYNMKSAFPRQGGASIGAQTVSSILTIIGPGNWVFTTLQNGKQAGIAHVVVSKDGKSALETNTRTDAAGKVSEYLLVYDKQ